MKYISLFFWFAYFVSMASHKSRESKAIHHFLKHPCQLYLICQMQHNPTSEDNTNHSVLYVVAMPMNVWGCIRDRYAPVEVGGHRVGVGWRSDPNTWFKPFIHGADARSTFTFYPYSISIFGFFFSSTGPSYIQRHLITDKILVINHTNQIYIVVLNWKLYM